MTMDAALQRDAFRPRRPDGLGKGALMAVLVHLLLILALALGVSWKVRQPEGVEAELWSAVPQVAAPPAVHHTPTPPAPQPRAAPTPPPPAPAPEVKPAPAVRAVPPPPPAIDAQIAIEQAKREEAKRQQAAEQAAALKRDQARQEAAKQEAARQEAAKQEAARQARLEKAQREKAEKVAAEEARRQEAARQAQAEQERKKQEQEQARVAAATAAQREAYLQRMQSQAGAANSTGTAARNSGPSATYAGRIKARIKPNIVFTDSISGNPTATVEVRVAPDGAITSRRLVKSSGVQSWDDAVLRAIDKTETLPRDVDGSVPPRMQIEFKPND